MSSTESFDAFYAETRDQLLLETYALTGDLSASRSAVRDAYAVAWHHWRRVSRAEEREGWVRPLAYARAQRRHTAKWWHRDRRLDDSARATFEALSTLSSAQRKVLVLGTLSGISTDELVRTVGRPSAEVERDLERATASFAQAREVGTADVPATMEQLRPLLERTRWPEAASVRRKGTTRRRTAAVAGVVLAVGAVVVTGTLLTDTDGAVPVSLRNETVFPPVTLKPPTEAEPRAADEAVLLSAEQTARVVPGLEWTEEATGSDVAELACQQEPLAALGAQTLLRSFSAGSERKGALATQAVLTSADLDQSMDTYATVRAWFTRCAVPRAQLLRTDALRNVGEEATLFTLRTWSGSGSDLNLAVARSGNLTFATTVTSTAGAVDVDAAASLLSAAVNRACGTDAAGRCAGQPRTKGVPPLPVGKPAGLLSVVDLPPVTDARGPWVGTDPAPPDGNPAATRCDSTTFTGRAVRAPTSRTFLFPRVRRAEQFGLAQVLARTPPANAQSLVDDVRREIRACAEDGFGTQVTRLWERNTGNSSASAWLVEVEVSQSRSIPFMMAIMREGNVVSQVGFTPAGSMTMSRDDFVGVTKRALERLSDTPRYKAN